tara:strand:- start:357 stop:575 length:219 start_codon:yes stop_codon:yes gene_type:complete
MLSMNSSFLNNLFIVVFLLNALFWGLASHKLHCKFAKMCGFTYCPPHWVHVYVMGLGSFIIALYLAQGSAGF